MLFEILRGLFPDNLFDPVAFITKSDKLTCRESGQGVYRDKSWLREKIVDL